MVEDLPPPPSETLADLRVLQDYVGGLVTLIMEESNRDVLSFLESGESSEILRRFVADPQIPTMLIMKTLTKEEGGFLRECNVVVSLYLTILNIGKDEESISYSLQTEMNFKDARWSAVALIKRGAVIEATRPIATQVFVMNLGEGSPFETLHTYIHNAVAPFFHSITKSSGARESDKDSRFGLLSPTSTTSA